MPRACHFLFVNLLVYLILPAAAMAQVIIGPGAGGIPEVQVIEPGGTRTVSIFDPAFLGGASVTLGDVNGDGTVDIIAGAGPGGGPQVRVLSGTDLSDLANFYAFDPSFSGGVRVATGDVNGDGRSDIIVGAGAGGGPHVRVFSGLDLGELANFYAYPAFFTGGVTVAAGDVDGDGLADIITGAGAGGGPHVRVFSGADLRELASFYAYDADFGGGVSVGAGDFNGDGLSDIVTGAGPGGGPHVRVFSGLDLGELASFYGFDSAFGGGVNVAAGDINGDGRVDLILGAGPGGDNLVRILSGVDFTELDSFFAPASMGSGISIGSVGDLPGLRFTSAAATTFTVGSAGTFTVTTAGNPVPAITSSGALPAGVTLSDNGDGTATLAGTPAAGTGGTYALTFTADNGVPSPATQTFTLNVNEAPAITSAAATTFPVGAAGTFSVTTTGFPVPTITRGGAALPAGITWVDNGDGTGTLSGTADASGAGTHTFTFTADNGVSPAATQSFTLTISGAPTFTSPATANFTVGSAGTFTVTTVATPTAALTLSGTLPTGVTFADTGTGTGTLSGTPAAGSGGIYPVTLTATNSVGSATQTLTITVRDVPVITSAAATTFTVGTPGTFTVTTTGLPAASLAVGGAALPAGVTFADNGDGIGTLSGTPAAGTAGTYAITFTATNTVGSSAPQAFTLTVNSAPAFTSAAATTFALGVAGTFAVTTVGTPTATLSVGALPGGVTFVDNLNGTGTLSGTPAAGTAGPHTLTFTATNGVGGPVTQTFTLTITAGPVITSASTATFALGAVNTFTVTASGFPAPSLVQGGAALPSGVTWLDNGDGTGTLSGTPAAGTGGTYALTFTASNGSGSAVQNFTLNVTGSPGFTSAATTTFTVGAAGTFTVTAIGAPAPAITVSGTLPSGVTFMDNLDGTGTLSGTPAAGTGGAHALTFTAANGVLPNGTQAFTLNVNEGPAITSAASATFTIGTPGSFTVTTSGSPTPVLAIGGVALPAGLTFVDNGNGTGTLSGTAAAGTGGTYAITFTATNTIGSSAPQAFTLTVSGPPSITSANTTTFTAGTPGSFTVTTIGSPTPVLSVSGTLPSGVTFTPNPDGTGTLSGTPGAATGGWYALTFTASNGVLPNATQAFTLIVNQAPAITSAANTTFTVGTLGSFTVTTSGFPVPSIARGGVALPAGVTFTDNGNGTGTLSGTPAAGTGGTYAITFTATNTVSSSAPQAFTLTVNQAPAITSANAVSFVVGTPGTFTVTTTGFPVSGITRTGVALPGGVTFTDNGNGTGTLSGTPAAGTAGSYAFTFTAANGVTPNAVQAFTLTVQQPPAITSAASTTFTVGTPGTFTVTTTGFPTPTVSQTGTLPTGVTFTPATRVLGGTATQTGAFPLVFAATNGVPPDATQNFTLNVVCPAIAVNPATMPEGLFQVAYAGVTFTQTGSTGSSITWSATGLPAGLAIGPTTGVVSGTPTNTVLNGAVVVTATDNFGCVGTRNTTITVRPTTDNEVYMGGVGHTQYATGAPFPATPHVAFVDNVKTGDNGPGALSVTFPGTSTNGGTIVEGTTDGTFIYTPALNFGGPTDTFTYTLTDGNLVTNTGTVTINLSNIVWYVNSSGGAGDGRSHSPFNTLNAAATPSGSTHIIYVHSGGATTPGNLAMDTNQTLHGAGAVFALNSLTIASGARPTLTGTVTLADNTTVRAVNFTPSGIPAMTASATSFAQPVTIDQVNVTGGTSALSLTNVTATATGAVNVSNASFTNTSAAEVLISQGTIPVTLAATATISSNAGRSVDIQNRTGGTVTFNGAITDTAQGVFLNLNTGSTINFTGGLALSTTTNPAFTATGGGTVSATQNNTTIVNTITTTTVTALNVASTTIGASGLTFRSISSSGGANGIVLNTTGSGAFTVTGVGTTDGDGGTIQNKTGNGATFVSTGSIALTNMNFTSNGTAQTVAGNAATCGGDLTGAGNLGCVSNLHLQSITGVTLTNLNVTNGGQMGINGNSVSGFSLINSVVTGNGNESMENGLTFVNLTGTSAITNSIIRDNAAYQVNVTNTANNSTLTLNVTGTRTNNAYPTMDTSTTEIGRTSPSGPFTNQAFLFNTSTTATNLNATMNFTGVVFNNAYPGNAVLMNPGAASGSFAGTTTNSSFDTSGGGLIIQMQNGMSGNYSVTNSEFYRTALQQILFSGLNPYNGTFQGVVQNNTIGAAASGSACFPTTGANCVGIDVNLIGGTGGIQTRIQSNTVQQFDNIGIRFTANGPGNLHANVLNNTVQNPLGLIARGIDTNVGTTGGAAIVGCFSITGNTVSGTFEDPGVGTQLGIHTRVRFLSEHRLPGMSGTGAANAVTFLGTSNPGAGGKIFSEGNGVPGYQSGAACITP